MRLVNAFFLLLLASINPAFSGEQRLLDSTLSQWDVYLSYAHSPDYNGELPKDQQGNDIQALGLNPADDHAVFTMTGEQSSILKISGEYYGALTTKQEFENYRLSLEVKWGQKIWPAREGKLRDTGILYHAIGPHGAEYFRSWMLSHEFQIMEGHMGDYWQQANGAIDIRAYQREYIMSPVADTRANWLNAGEGGEAFVMRSANHESMPGEWTKLELISVGNKNLHIVNGEVVMVLKNPGYVDESGKRNIVTKGKIQLQSEASEVYFRNIFIEQLSDMPEEYAALFWVNEIVSFTQKKG